MLSSSSAPATATAPPPPASSTKTSTAAASGSLATAAKTHHDVPNPTQCVVARLESSIGATAQLLASIASRPRPDQMFALTTAIASTILPAQYDALAALQSTGRQPNDQPPPPSAAAATDELAARDATIQQLETRVQEQGTKLNAAQAQVQGRDARIAQLDERLTAATRDAEDLRGRLAFAVAQAQTTIAQNDQLLADRDRNLAAARTQISRLSAETEALRQQLTTAHSDADRLRAQLADRDQQLRAAAEAPDALAARLQAGQSDLLAARQHSNASIPSVATPPPSTAAGDVADRKRRYDEGNDEEMRWQQPLEQVVLARPDKQRRVGSLSPQRTEGNESSSGSSSGSTQMLAQPPIHIFHPNPSASSFTPIRRTRPAASMGVAATSKPSTNASLPSLLSMPPIKTSSASGQSHPRISPSNVPSSSSTSPASDSNSTSDDNSSDADTDTDQTDSLPSNRRRSMRLTPPTDPLFPLHEPLSIPTCMLERACGRPRYNRDEDEDHVGALQLYHAPGTASLRVLAHKLAPLRALGAGTCNKYVRAIWAKVEQANRSGNARDALLAHLYAKMLAQPLGTRMTHPNLHRQLKNHNGSSTKTWRRCAVDSAWVGPVFEVDVVQDPDESRRVRSELEEQMMQLMCLQKQTARLRQETMDLVRAARVAVCVGIECAGLEYPLKASKVPKANHIRYVLRERYALVVQEEDAEDDEDEGEGEEEGLVEEETDG